MTKPSRSLSKGLDARWGSSLRVDRAFMELNPATDRGVMVDSTPPVIMASARPSLISEKA